MKPGERMNGAEQSGLPEAVLAQLYRGELSRSDRWRTRLDTTTNWALTTSAAAISYGFASAIASHVVILTGLWMVTTFLLIEARRYRYYDLWIRRVRLLEDGFWAPILRQEPADPDAIKELAAEMSRRQIRLSLFSALATRLNRAYGPIFLVLIAAWFTKLYGHHDPPASWRVFVERAHVGPITGAWVMGILIAYSLAAIALIVVSWFAKPPLGEFKAQPRARRIALWEVFARPYRMQNPRRSEPARHPSHPGIERVH